jgi:hypothetical protein
VILPATLPPPKDWAGYNRYPRYTARFAEAPNATVSTTGRGIRQGKHENDVGSRKPDIVPNFVLEIVIRA